MSASDEEQDAITYAEEALKNRILKRVYISLDKVIPDAAGGAGAGMYLQGTHVCIDQETVLPERLPLGTFKSQDLDLDAQSFHYDSAPKSPKTVFLRAPMSRLRLLPDPPEDTPRAQCHEQESDMPPKMIDRSHSVIWPEHPPVENLSPRSLDLAYWACNTSHASGPRLMLNVVPRLNYAVSPAPQPQGQRSPCHQTHTGLHFADPYMYGLYHHGCPFKYSSNFGVSPICSPRHSRC